MSLVRKILKEAKQRGPLYHFTNYFNLQNIIATNTLKSNSYLMKGKMNGISTTRNKKFNDSQRDEIGGVSICLELNGDKISEKYKIIPYNYFSHEQVARPEHTESEEFIITPSSGLVNIKRYIEDIIIFPDKEVDQLMAKRTFEIFELLDKFEIPYSYDDVWDETIEEYKQEVLSEQ